MSVVAVICLCAIVGAFVLFAVVLAWGEDQTRNIVHPNPSESHALRSADAGVARLRVVAKKPREANVYDLVRGAPQLSHPDPNTAVATVVLENREEAERRAA